MRFSGGSATSLNKRAALIYWELMQVYIELYTYDPEMINVVNVGAKAAQDTLSGTYDEDVKTSLKIPWWIYAIPLSLFFFKRS